MASRLTSQQPDMAIRCFVATLASFFVVTSADEPEFRAAVAPCVHADDSCNPALDRCCQGPGLMTCRLRSNTKDAGMSYRCGAEFAHELISLSKCIPEGELCEPEHSKCCQVDSKMPMNCTMPKKDKKGGKPQPKCMAMRSAVQLESCVEEGSSCSPLENRCCQGQEKIATQALRTCQLKFSERPNVHSPAYVCAKEFTGAPEIWP